jgi:hypothetical protein
MAFRFLDGKDGDVSDDAAAKAQVLVVGDEATGDPEVARAFSDVKLFRSWAETSPIAERVDAVYRTLEQEVLPQRASEKWIEQMQTLALKRKQDDIAALAELARVDIRDEELAKLTMIERTPLTPVTFDPIILWDRRIEVEPPTGAPQDSRTSTMFIPPGWWPWLGWVGWDNRASSARVFALNILCDGAWFGGRWLWLIGFNMLLNLDRVFFDRMATSVISF